MNRQKREAVALTSTLPRLAEVLDRAGHRYALIGGLAVGVWVEPRATKDIDLIIGAKLHEVDALLRASQDAGFEVRAEEAERLKLSHMTRLWATDRSGEPFMIDLLLDEHPFYDSVLDRSRVQPLGDQQVSIATPEDLLLMKLLASRPQDIADAASLVATYGDALDRAYLDRWAHELDIEDAVRQALGEDASRPRPR